MRSIISIGWFVNLAALFRPQGFLILDLCRCGCWEGIFRQYYFGSRWGCMTLSFVKSSGNLFVNKLAASGDYYLRAALSLRSYIVGSLRNYTQGITVKSPTGYLLAIGFSWSLILEASLWCRSWCCRRVDGSFLSGHFLGALWELSLLAWRAYKLVIIEISNGCL